MPPPPLPHPEPTDEADRKLLADVKQYGWHVILVEEDQEGPGFGYSIGFERSLGHPEIIVFGLEVDVMHRIINGIGEQVRAGQRFEHRDEADDVLENYKVFFRAVDRRHYQDYLGCARWFYQGDGFEVLQCVWPDANHRFPWHPEFSSPLVPRQPLLADDPAWPFHEGRNRAVFTTRPVLEESHPILRVTHDHDGDWQFLCGTTNRTEDGRVVCLGTMVQHDSTLTQLADLPEGWRAHRDSPGSAWERQKIDEHDGQSR